MTFIFPFFSMIVSSSNFSCRFGHKITWIKTLDRQSLPSEKPPETHGLSHAMKSYPHSSSDRCYVKFLCVKFSFFCSIVMWNAVIVSYLLLNPQSKYIKMRHISYKSCVRWLLTSNCHTMLFLWKLNKHKLLTLESVRKQFEGTIEAATPWI